MTDKRKKKKENQELILIPERNCMNCAHKYCLINVCCDECYFPIYPKWQDREKMKCELEA